MTDIMCIDLSLLNTLFESLIFNHSILIKSYVFQDKSHMQHRYIELFMDSTPGGNERGFGNGFGGRGL